MSKASVDFTHDQQTEMMNLYQAGSSLRELATKYGSSVPRVQRTLQSFGVTLRKRGRIKGKANINGYHRKATVGTEGGTTTGSFTPAGTLDQNQLLLELGLK